MREQYSDLSTWPGLAHFKDHVCAVTAFSDMPEVLMANRTSHLTRLAVSIATR